MAEPFYTVRNFRPSISIGYLIRRLNKLGLGRLEHVFDDVDFSFTQWAVLSLIRNGVTDTASGLARDLDHDSGAMTRVIDQLEERGLLRRSRDAADRRVIKLELTEAGDDMVTTLGQRVMTIWNELLDGFESAEINNFIAMLSRLLARFEALENNDGEDGDDA